MGYEFIYYVVTGRMFWQIFFQLEVVFCLDGCRHKEFDS